MFDIRWIMDHAKEMRSISGQVYYLARSSTSCPKFESFEANRSINLIGPKQAACRLPVGGQKLHGGSLRVAVGLSSQCRLGVKTKVFALLIQFAAHYWQ